MQTGRLWEAIGTICIIVGMIVAIASGSAIGTASMVVGFLVFLIGRFL